MFVESLEKLPEELRGDFVESEFNGKKGFQHKDTIALANSLKNAKAERDQHLQALFARHLAQHHQEPAF